VGLGELVVVVPAGTPTEVEASVGLGGLTDDITANGTQDTGGAGLRETTRYGTGTPVIRVEAKLGLGRIWIVPQGTNVAR
jgi:hypothetical protein